MSKYLDEMMNGIVEAASAYARAYNDGAKKSELKVLKSAANDACSKYNLELSKATYRQWAKEGDPVKTAIRNLFVPGTKKLSFKTDDENYMTVHILDSQFECNLPQMQATLGTGVFNDPKWFAKAEKLAFIVSNHLNQTMNNSPLFKYEVSQAAKDFEFDGIDPLSEEGVGIALQSVIDAILFIEDPENSGENLIKARMREDESGKYSPEWNVIYHSMTARDGVNSLKVANTGMFTTLVMEAMNRILTNGTVKFEITGNYEMPKADEPKADEPKAKKPAKKSAKKSAKKTQK